MQAVPARAQFLAAFTCGRVMLPNSCIQPYSSTAHNKLSVQGGQHYFAVADYSGVMSGVFGAEGPLCGLLQESCYHIVMDIMQTVTVTVTKPLQLVLLW